MIWLVIIVAMSVLLSCVCVAGMYYQHHVNVNVHKTLVLQRQTLEALDARLGMQGERLDDHWDVIMERLPKATRGPPALSEPLA